MNTNLKSSNGNKRPTPKADQNTDHYPDHRESRNKLNQNKLNQNNKSEINDSSAQYNVSLSDVRYTNKSTQPDAAGLSASQQQFVLKFCSQLASVIEACEHSESAEIEVGRRQINRSQIKVKLLAERELTLGSNTGDNGHH